MGGAIWGWTWSVLRAWRIGHGLGQIQTALRTSLRDRPVLTIFGQYNDPLHFQRRWHELFPHVCQVVIASGNHFPVNDDPQGVAAAIRAWWQDNS